MTLLTFNVPSLKPYAEFLYDLIAKGEGSLRGFTFNGNHEDIIPLFSRSLTSEMQVVADWPRFGAEIPNTPETKKLLDAVYGEPVELAKGFTIRFPVGVNPDIKLTEQGQVVLTWKHRPVISHEMLPVGLSSVGAVYLHRDRAIIDLRGPNVELTWH